MKGEAGDSIPERRESVTKSQQQEAARQPREVSGEREDLCDWR